ncbi:MAG: phage baseplate assembly protein V [Lachnospiraceae bacterium]|nr:phage baseplate assembly protein V [Lachnospiraceae bacterium]
MDFEELLMQNQGAHGTAVSGCSGIATGIVKENWNEEAKGMVLVEMSLGEEGKTDTEWIPVMQPYCGNGFGQYFLPEVNSQVVLGFQGGDINCPVVLGCLWNDADALPEETAREDNSLKRIRTKGGNRIELDETEGKEQLGLYTKGGISIVLQDENQLAAIRDSAGATMLQLDMKNGEIKICADKRLVLSVGGKDALVIDGNSGKVELSANSIAAEGKQSLQLKTQNARLEGSRTEIKAQGSLKVNSGGILELKGTMTKIN